MRSAGPEEYGVLRSTISIAATTKALAFSRNQRTGRRWSAARGFLKPVLNRPNLRVETGCLAERVEFDGWRATGVTWRQDGVLKHARAKGEVVLSAGSIGSVQLLLLSGIGPGRDLLNLGIPVVLDRPGVGHNLQDHLQLRMIYNVSGVKTLNETYHSLFGRAAMGLDYALRRRGPLTMAPSQLGLFTRSDPSRERANIQFHVQPLSLDKFGDPLHAYPAFTTSVCNLTAKPRRRAPELGRSGRQADIAPMNFSRRRSSCCAARSGARAIGRSQHCRSSSRSKRCLASI